MNFFQTIAPSDNQTLRQMLYSGTVFRLPPNATSLALIAQITAEIQDTFGITNIRQAQFQFSDGEFFQQIGTLRKKLYTSTPYLEAAWQLMVSLGFERTENAFDPIRLRVITHKGFENPQAAPIYYAHRDTWYAHSQAEITWWVPLHDATAEETFVFYPDYFQREVPNNSAAFDYDEWTQHGTALRIGWQNPQHGSSYLFPGQTGEVDFGETITFAAEAGEIVLFAGAHFHQTRKNSTGRTRFSVDFRTVNKYDHRMGLGAPNVDNRSRGSALREYIGADPAS